MTQLHPPYALAISLGLFAVVATVLALVRRRSALVRQLLGPLVAVAIALAFVTYGLLARGLLADRALRVWTVAGIVLGMAILHLVTLYFFEVRLGTRGGIKVPPLIPRVVVGTLYLLALLGTLPLLFEGLDLAPLLATSAVTSLVLGLALQPILGNFFSGLVITIERPFRINDWVEVDGIQGRVVDITWRTTHIRTRDSDNLIVPNSQIADKALLNYYYPHPLHMVRIAVGAEYRTPPHRVTQALLEAARQVRGVLDKPSSDVFLVAFGESSVDYELRVWIQDVAEQPRIASDCRQRIWESFKVRGIVVPFPIRTLEIDPAANLVRTDHHQDTELPASDGVAPAAWLFVEQGAERGRAVRLGAEPVVVGRGLDCDLSLSEVRASKRHFQVSLQGEVFVLEDLESSHGTLVNEQPVQGHALAPYQRIRIGDTVLVFEPAGTPRPPAC